VPIDLGYEAFIVSRPSTLTLPNVPPGVREDMKVPSAVGWKKAKRQRVSFRFEWSYHCRGCPLRSECVLTGQSHRTIVVGQYHDYLQQRRRDQQSKEFKEQMQQRNAIEGTINELARAHGLRRSRYRGFAKVEPQNLFIGTACNVKRCLSIVAEIKIGSNIHILHFRNSLRLNGDYPGSSAQLTSLLKRDPNRQS
jgi:hypothetical protein